MTVLIVMLGVALTVGHFLTGTTYAEEKNKGGTIGVAPFPADEIPDDEVDQEMHALIWCNYTTEGDYPHISSSGLIASAHGWWENTSPSRCPEYAVVTIWLQARYCYFNPDGDPQWCWYRTVGHDKDRLRAGGGSANRVVARNACSSTQLVGYRSVIDVDLVGYPDGRGKTYKYRNLNCHPS